MIFYGTQRGNVILRNDSGAYPTSLTSSTFTIAYVAKENRVLWTNSSGNVYAGAISIADATSFVHVKELVQNRKRKKLMDVRKEGSDFFTRCRII